MATMLAGALAVGLPAVAWSAGFFWAWSSTVVPGFAAAPPEAAVAAMRAVNANVAGPASPSVFFGPAVLAAPSAALAFAAGANAAAWAAFAAAVYAAGVVGVAFVAGNPLNNALAAASSAQAAAAEAWGSFAGPWTAWHHLRTAAASAAFLLVAAAAVLAVQG